MRLAWIGSAIGCGWALYAASLLPGPWSILIGIAAFAATIWSIAAGRGGGSTGPLDPYARRRRLGFTINLVFEILLLNIALYATTAIGRPDLLIPAISLAVAIHFVPMVRIYAYPRFLGVAAAMAGAAIVAAVLILGGMAQRPVIVAEALANALILWTSVRSATRARR